MTAPCTPGHHRCVALMLWFFAVLNRDPDAAAQARAAVRRCEGNV